MESLGHNHKVIPWMLCTKHSALHLIIVIMIFFSSNWFSWLKTRQKVLMFVAASVKVMFLALYGFLYSTMPSGGSTKGSWTKPSGLAANHGCSSEIYQAALSGCCVDVALSCNKYCSLQASSWTVPLHFQGI